MKQVLISIVAGVFLMALALPASATCATNLCGVQPFTAGTRYMSLEGYTRWQEYRAHRQWVSPHEAVALTEQQRRLCPPEQRG